LLIKVGLNDDNIALGNSWEQTMKIPIIVLLSIAVMPLAWADELKIKGFIKADPLRSNNHYLISNDNGKSKARIKTNPLWPQDSGRYLIIDKDGNERGRIKPDYINKDRYIIETVDDD
jgi:hypothetical protein